MVVVRINNQLRIQVFKLLVSARSRVPQPNTLLTNDFCFCFGLLFENIIIIILGCGPNVQKEKRGRDK